MIEKIQKLSGKAIPLEGNDIDTDRIIPARFMKCLTFDGLGDFAFYDVKFKENGEQKDHILNSSHFEDHSILITNRNFGCGSSREHAPWALKGMGIKCIIAQSYAEIFANNCSSLGIPALILNENDCRELQALVLDNSETELEVDLISRTVTAGKRKFTFTIPENYRVALIEGKWDTTSMLQESMDEIKSRHKQLTSFQKTQSKIILFTSSGSNLKEEPIPSMK